jgi:HAD superfamily hydrolase (TIGR01509 family)
MSFFQAVILDFDGLILETESACYGGWRAVFQDAGADYSIADYQQIIGSEADPCALWEERCGDPFDWPAVQRRRREVENRLNANLVVQPGVVALLDQARRLGLRLGIASSSPHRWVDRHLAEHGLLDRFDAIVCRDDAARAKPHPDLYLEVVRRLDVIASRTLAFEDSHNGSRAAKSAGLRCVAVPTAMTNTQDFSHVDAVVPTLAGLDLAAVLERFAAIV